MKKLQKWMILLLCLALLPTVAMAGEGLNARIEEETLKVSWEAVGSGTCLLTVYRDGWPMKACNVSGPSGNATIALGGATGSFSVRLRTANGCLAADAVPAEAPSVPALPSAPTATPLPATTPALVGHPAAAPDAGGSKGSLAAQVVAQVNEERAKQGLSELRVDSELTRAACVRAQEIVQSFSHTRPDGSAWSTVSAGAYGENIAMGHRTVDKVMAAWMSSQGHRENILRASFSSIGVCAYVYDGVLYWVQLFGR